MVIDECRGRAPPVVSTMGKASNDFDEVMSQIPVPNLYYQQRQEIERSITNQMFPSHSAFRPCS